MTVSSTTTKNSYSGNGSTHSFAYGFKIFADADLTVIIRSSTGVETVRTLNTHYIVTNAGNDSGGNVLFKFNTGTSSDAHFSSSDFRPASGETVVIRRNLTLTQGTDYVENDPFPAESHENALDRVTFITQQLQEELDRSIKLSRTNTITSPEFTTSSTDRANKVLAFDSSGEISVTQELGTFKGDWAASTSYLVRDIVKDTSTNNIFIVTTAHTSSGSQPLTTNANSAKYSLIVDAASATTSATNAASSATAAASSASTASTQASNASSSASTASTQASNASTSATNAASSATAAASSASQLVTLIDNFDDVYLGAKSSEPSVDNDGDALNAGDLFYDTSVNALKVYSGSAWQITTQTSLTEVSGDSTPQLGGDLDVQTNAIVTTSNRNIALTPNGTGVVRIDGNVDIQTGEIVLKNGGSQSNIKLYCESSNAHYAQLTAPAHSDFAGNITIVLPATAGTLALTSQLKTSGISSGNVATFGSGVADDDFLRVNGTTIEGRSASELATDIGATTKGFAVAMAIAL
tara:strand:+ start:10599 stop:12173 length:1575 start_codon:yes stop_codon:yes gene_type:complete